MRVGGDKLQSDRPKQSRHLTHHAWICDHCPDNRLVVRLCSDRIRVMERERRIVPIEYGNRPADSQDTCDFFEHRLRVINVAQQRMCNDGIKRFVGDGDALHISRSEVYSSLKSSRAAIANVPALLTRNVDPA